MTLLHQAAQKAVEARDDSSTVRQIDAPDAGPIPEICDGMDKAGVWSYAHLCGYRAALQQQPEPVAPIGWLYDWTHSSALGKPDEQFTGFTTDEAHARKHDSPRAVYAAPPALQHQEVPSTAVIPPAPPECETEDEKTAFSFGYWQGLHAARKGQEVPREPVAVARPLTSEEEEAAWNSITEQGCSCCTAAVRLFCCLNGITLSDAVLATSPSTTRQQEVGSTPEGFRLLPVEATDAMMYADWDVTMSDAHSNGGVSAAAWRAMAEAAPQVTYGDGHSGVGWYMHDTDYPEEGAVFLGAASPSTPENADSVGGKTK